MDPRLEIIDPRHLDQKLLVRLKNMLYLAHFYLYQAEIGLHCSIGLRP